MKKEQCSNCVHKSFDEHCIKENKFYSDLEKGTDCLVLLCDYFDQYRAATFKRECEAFRQSITN